MSDYLKVTTIGGGSSYTPEIVEGFINRYDKFPVNEICFVDIEDGQEKMDIVVSLAKRMVEKAGLPIIINSTLDRRAALEGASFVTTQFRVGLLPARKKDEHIPAKHGMLGQETNGAGGLLKALRTIPVIDSIIDDIREICPDAWLINFTNPAGIVSEFALNYKKFEKFIGLCNVPIGMEMGMAAAMKKEREDFEFDLVGLNHFVYMTDVKEDGKSVMDHVIELMKDPSKLGLDPKNVAAIDWNHDFIKSLGALPCPYHRYYYKRDHMLKDNVEKQKEGKTRADEVMAVEKKLFELYKDPDLAVKPKELEERGGAHYSTAACNCIVSIYNDTGDVQVVNTKNGGIVPSLDPNSAIEVSSRITKDGPVPVKVKPLPSMAEAHVGMMKSFERLACEAAIEGDYNKALMALTMNPLSYSDDVAKTVLDELFEAHKPYLDRFNK